MIIIFGTRRRLTVANPGEVLPHSCPHCSGDLTLKENKTWFTLFFLPIFPVSNNGSFYHCNRCDGAYKSEAREYFLSQQGTQ